MVRVLGLLIALSVWTSPGNAADAAAKARELDTLFQRLATASSGLEAGVVEGLIFEALAENESPTAELLFARGLEAAAEGDLALAADLLDRTTDFEPSYAEAWHQLGRVHMSLDDHIEALDEMERAVTLEPRHFAAHLAIGRILELYGNRKGAMTAYQRALALNPSIEGIGPRIDALEREVHGQGI